MLLLLVELSQLLLPVLLAELSQLLLVLLLVELLPLLVLRSLVEGVASSQWPVFPSQAWLAQQSHLALVVATAESWSARVSPPSLPLRTVHPHCNLQRPQPAGRAAKANASGATSSK